jgi:hypothetical protein
MAAAIVTLYLSRFGLDSCLADQAKQYIIV